MKQLFLALLLLPIIANAQVTNAVVKENSWTGIKWTTGLSWEQIKAKAKAENKYIFLDIYATWCGPCKEMEKNVFVSDAVGNYFNDKFISVRVQEDKTKNDNEEIKKWYDDAKAITRQFDIDVFPSFLFLNPQGIPTDLQIGYKGSTELINIAQASMLVGRVYTPRPEAFRNFKAEYRNGNINYKELPAMILLSARFDTSFRSELVSTYREYIGKLKSKERYNKQNISFWASFNVSSKSQFFQYFTRDGEQVDKAMQEPGFSARFIDRVVQHEIVTPFFIEQAKGSGRLMAGPYVLRSDDQGDKREADWSTLEKLIATKFDKKITERAMYTARIEWYSRFSNVEAVRNYTILKIRKYPMDFFCDGIPNKWCVLGSIFRVHRSEKTKRMQRVDGENCS